MPDTTDFDSTKFWNDVAIKNQEIADILREKIKKLAPAIPSKRGEEHIDALFISLTEQVVKLGPNP